MNNLRRKLEKIRTDIRAGEMADACKIGKTINVTLKSIEQTWCAPDLKHKDYPAHIIHVDKILSQITSGTFLDCLGDHFDELLAGKCEDWCKGISIAIEVLDALEESALCKVPSKS